MLSYDPATNKLTFTSDGTGAMGNLVMDLNGGRRHADGKSESYSVALATPTSTTGSSIALGANSVTTTILDNDIDVAPVVDLNGGSSGNNNTVSYPHGESQLPDRSERDDHRPRLGEPGIDDGHADQSAGQQFRRRWCWCKHQRENFSLTDRRRRSPPANGLR